MTAPSFSYSGNVYTSAAAGSVDFALTSTTGNPIAYLEKAHIHVYKSTNQGSTWTELTRPSQWDFVSGGTVARLVTGIATGDWIKVQRITPSTAAYVTFQSSSLLTADQLNDDTLFNTYLNQERYDQGDQSSAVAAAASASAASATSAATAATATANAASTAAAAATTTANAASASAATALSQSNTAITDSAAALAASANAVTTANTAASNAASAVTTAGTANTNATAAVNTANTAASNASTALSQSTTALSNSATALSTANTASSNASTALTNSSNAVTTANTASTNASNAVTTANTANTNATAALNAVASSLQYVLVANVAAIPSSPANNYAIEVADSTGVESFSPLANRPAGFVGDVGLSVRMQYSTTGPTWNWLNYFPNNAETRYLKLAGGTLTGQLRADDSTSVAAPVIAFDGDTNTGLAHTGADELALVTGGTARLTVDPSGAVAVTNALSVGGQAAVVTNDARLSDTRTPTDGSVTNAKVSASAAIAGTKISPDFGSQNVATTGTSTAASFIPTSSTVPANGVYLPAANSVAISTNSTGRLFIDSSGRIGVGNSTPGSFEADANQFVVGSGSGNQGVTIYSGNTSQGIIYFADGTTSAQKYTGFISYDHSANAMRFGTNDGNERMRLDASGRLGIGTSTVGGKLSVSTSSADGYTINSWGDGYFIVSPSATTTSSALALSYDSTSNTGNITCLSPGVSWRGINYRGDGHTFYTSGNTARVTIDSSGRLGIGTASPGAAFHCAGAITSTPTGSGVLGGINGTYGQLKLYGSSGGLLDFGSSGADYTGRIRYDVADNSMYVVSSNNIRFELVGSGEAARIDSSKRLLVGTSSDLSSGENNRLIQAAASNGAFVLLSRTDATITNNEVLAGVEFRGNGNPSASIYAWADADHGTNDYPGRLVFSTTADGASSPTERMRIRNNGEILFGCSGLSGDGPDTAGGIYQQRNGNTKVRVATDGSAAFQFYSNTSPTTSVGSISVNASSVAFNTSSDYRLKENITLVTDGIIRLQQLKPSRFNFIADSDHTVDGFIAHEVQSVVPEAITGTKDEVDADGNPVYQGIDQSKLVPLLTAALQEAIGEIESLKARVAALESA